MFLGQLIIQECSTEVCDNKKKYNMGALNRSSGSQEGTSPSCSHQQISPLCRRWAERWRKRSQGRVTATKSPNRWYFLVCIQPLRRRLIHSCHSTSSHQSNDYVFGLCKSSWRRQDLQRLTQPWQESPLAKVRSTCLLVCKRANYFWGRG